MRIKGNGSCRGVELNWAAMVLQREALEQLPRAAVDAHPGQCPRQVGCGLEQPALVGAAPAHGRGFRKR